VFRIIAAYGGTVVISGVLAGLLTTGASFDLLFAIGSFIGVPVGASISVSLVDWQSRTSGQHIIGNVVVSVFLYILIAIANWIFLEGALLLFIIGPLVFSVVSIMSLRRIIKIRGELEVDGEKKDENV